MTHRMFDDSLLDTAPQTDRDVRYPDWGDEPKKAAVSSVGVGTPSQSKMTSSHLGQIDESLQRFLSNNGIDYEIYPGNFLIVRVMRAITFDSGSARVSRDSRPWLSSIRRYLEKEASNDLEVVVDGHTDDIGNAKSNDRLSKRRAEAVKALLLSPRASVDSIYTRAYGAIVPACTNKTRQGKACNRRVELFFILPK